ncbi:MAG: ATP-binding cassette domain-containing protein, partial [Bdellovibrio sp.]
MSALILEARGLTKTYGATRALSAVDLDLSRGEIVSLLGANGSGKSTLTKILVGEVNAESGVMKKSPHARVGRVPQDPQVCGELNLLENLELGIENTNSIGWIRPDPARALAVLKDLGWENADLSMLGEALSPAQVQLVEIARQLLRNPEILILDEPTSRLGAQETSQLFQILQRLRGQGLCLLLVSHNVEDVLPRSDRFLVLRDGKSVLEGVASEEAVSRVIEILAGGEKERGRNLNSAESQEVFNLKGLVAHQFRAEQLKLFEKEILGIFGLQGSGRSTALRALFGLMQAQGDLRIRGQDYSMRKWNPGRALEAGLDFACEDRGQEGLALDLSIRDNILLSSRSRFWSRQHEDELRDLLAQFQTKYQSLDQKVSELSGGNQQKVFLARLAFRGNRILMLDEPFQGVDIGTKGVLARWIVDRARAGSSFF